MGRTVRLYASPGKDASTGGQFRNAGPSRPPPLELGRSLFNEPALSGLGTLYTAGYLRARGHDVTLVDAFLLEDAVPPADRIGRSPGLRVGGTWTALAEAVGKAPGPFDAVIVAKARWWATQRGPALARFLRAVRAREPAAPIGLADLFIGDLYLPPYDPASYLTRYPELDFVLHGAGESAVETFLAAPRSGWGAVPGLAFRSAAAPDGGSSDAGGAAVRFNGFHYESDIADLDELPYLAYDIPGFAAYVRFLLAAERADLLQESHEGEPLLALLATRGCNQRCRFCAIPGYGVRYRAHSVAYLEAMLLWLHEQSGARKFVLNDPSMNADPAFFKSFLRMMRARGFRFLAPSGLRADRIDREALELLAPTTTVLITALETPDAAFANKHIKKGLDPDRVVELAAGCQDVGLPLKVHYIIGSPGETAADVNATLSHAVELLDRYGALPLVQIATPIPGCEMFAEVQAKGYLDEPPEEIQRILPELFQTRSVITTPALDAGTVTRMLGHFQRYIGREHPREEMVAVTFACNNRCPHCLFGDCRIRPPTVADVEARAARARRAGVTTMVFEGGEPTLHKHLVELVAVARAAGMREVMLETNGRRCADRAYAAALAGSGVTLLAVTIEGPDPMTHDAVTGVRGSFAQTVQGLSNLVSAGFRDILLNVPLHGAMVRDEKLEDTVRLGLTLGVRAFMLQHLTSWGRLRGDAATLPTYREVLPRIAYVLDRYRARGRFRVSNVPFCLLRGYEDCVHPDVNNIGRIGVDDAGTVVSIPAALAQGKQKDALCATCEHGFLCTGFLPQPPRVGAASLAALPRPADRG